MGGKITSSKDKTVVKNMNPRFKSVSDNSISTVLFNKEKFHMKRVSLVLNNNNSVKKAIVSKDLSKDSLDKKSLKLFKTSNDTLEDLDLLQEAFNKNFYMKNLDKKLKVDLIRKMSLQVVNEDTILFKQGSPGNYLYVIKKGSVELLINDIPVKQINKGECFGELDLLYEIPRSGTVRSLEETFIYCLEKKAFKTVFNQMNELNFEENKKFADSIGLLCK
jgi:hypothetical protein